MSTEYSLGGEKKERKKNYTTLANQRQSSYGSRRHVNQIKMEISDLKRAKILFKK